MSLNFPENRKEISDRMKSDVKSNLPQSNPFLRNSFLQALIFGIAGRLYDMSKLASNLLAQLFWDTATGEYLERHAAIFGIERNAATNSIGSVTATGTAGINVPSGTQLTDSDGQIYEVQATVTLATNSITVTSITQSAGIATVTTPSDHEYAANIDVTISGANETEYNGTFTILSTPTSDTFTYAVDAGASSPATGTITSSAITATLDVVSDDEGSSVNQDSGAELTFTTPIAGVDDLAYVQSDGISGGSDLETDDDFNERFLFRVQNPVSLFNANAIEVEAKKITGVTRVWVFNVDDTQGNLSASSLTQAGNEVAVFNLTNHGLEDGQKVTVSGAAESEYNVSRAKTIKIDDDNFAYAISGNPSSPASGTPVAAYSLVEEGQTQIYFTRDNDSSPIPSATEVSAVKTQILTIKPAHISDDDVIVSGPTAVTTNFTFNTILPDTPTMRTAIENNLEAFFLDKTNVGESIEKNAYESAIFNTVDPENNQALQSFTLTSPSTAITIGRGEIGLLGTVTF
ncbi:MAG: baseplate J/gp47 family protein [Thermoplasmatales archaeon]|nr:MAG: baseplate J/gp47 family protein [Thermoplasmatales archaeon]